MKIIYSLMISLLLTAIICCTDEKDVISSNKKISSIVSLSPSITKQIIDLKSEKMLSGVTLYHPKLKRNIDIVGSLVNPNIEKILLLNPDIVLFSEEDAIVQNVERLNSLGVKSYRFKRNNNFNAICENYRILGIMLNKKKLAESKIKLYKAMIAKYMQKPMKIRIAFFLSYRPLITASGSSYIGQIIQDSGGINVYNELKRPYPIISIESLVKKDPDVIISMLKGADSYFMKRFAGFNLKVKRSNSIYTVGTDNIPFYTPRDYIESIRKISGILIKEKHAYEKGI